MTFALKRMGVRDEDCDAGMTSQTPMLFAVI